jgi:FdrA protein
MAVHTRVKPSEYHDSISLMQTAQALLRLTGVSDAAVVMGTPANREILASAALLTAEAIAAHPDDLVIVVKAADDSMALEALARAEEMLAARTQRSVSQAEARAKSLASAIAAHPTANLAVISVAGRHAAQEAREALKQGLHVLLFSDNVPLADEVALKRTAVERGLLCMGPDAGSAIINGIGLGFANAVPRGSIGVVSASGTGLQGVTCGIAKASAGVSQAIGTGSRDLSEEVGGLMMSAGLAALQADPATNVIVLISKPPAAGVAAQILAEIRASEKPTIVCFLGADPAAIEAAGGLAATTLTQAAVMAAAASRGAEPTAALAALETESLDLIRLAAAERRKLAPGQRALRGLFAGGTFCYETQLILRNLPEPVFSNAPILEANMQPGGTRGSVHGCIDLGGDEYTQGRLHPMIDPSLRNRRIVQEALDPQTAVILLDVVLGYGVHPDPAGATAEAIREAQHLAANSGRHLTFVGSVCGTEADPQRLSRQETTLRDAGVLVLPDNASAARLAGLIIQALHE